MPRKNEPVSLISPNIVLSMALLMFLLIISLIWVSKAKDKVYVVTQAAPQESLLTETDEVDDLEQDLKYLQIDPVVEEMKVFDSLN